MKRSATVFVALFSIFMASVPVFATTTVTVEDNSKVTVDPNAPPAIVVQATPVVIAQTEDPRKLEGEIIRVDIPESQILVRDVDSRERRVELKQGMISGYKVGDYVQIYLMADLKEAKTIRTVRTADIDGEVVATDYTRSQIIVRDSSGADRVVILSPGMNNKYQVKDRVQLYVVAEQPDIKEVRLIRVK